MANPYRDAYDRMNRQAAAKRPKPAGGPVGLSKADIAAIANAGRQAGPPSLPATLDALLERAPGWRPYLGAVKNAADVARIDDAQLLAALVFQSPKPPEKPAALINGTAAQMGRTIRDYGGDLDTWYGATFGARPDGSGPSALFRRADVADYQPRLPISDEQATAKRIAKVQGDIAVNIARRSAEATIHYNDPWVTVTRDRAGHAIGFGEAYGSTPPPDVLRAGGRPLTRNGFAEAFPADVETVYEEFTGSPPTAADVEAVLAQGRSRFAIRRELASRPGFTTSPVWRATAPGLAADARQMLGTDPPPQLIRDALAAGWDSATFAEHVRKLPAYTAGPEFTERIAANRQTYQDIYGAPDRAANKWLHEATLNGWTPDAVAGKLRDSPAWKYSPEAQTRTIALLDELGLFVGARPIVKPIDDPPLPASEPLEPAVPAQVTLPKPPPTAKPQAVRP